MINKDALFRFLCIDHRLRRNPAPTLMGLSKFCAAQFEEVGLPQRVSQETIKKDIQTLRKEFFAPIDFKKANNTYFYQSSDYTLLRTPAEQMHFLFQYLRLSYVTKDVEDLNSLIQFESIKGGVAGWNYLPSLINAIKSKKWIQFNYQSVQNNDVKTYCIAPLLLKQSRNSWYLLGIKKDEKVVRTFHLGRVDGEIKTLRSKHNCSDLFNPDTYFSKSSGITAPQFDSPVKVILEVDKATLAKYLTEKPLHHSQTILSSTDKVSKLQMTVEPTYELISNVLALGDRVSVIEPMWLTKEIYRFSVSMVERHTKSFLKHREELKGK